MNPLLFSVHFVLLLVLLSLSATFSGSETALFSLNPLHLHRIGRSNPKAARLLEQLLAHPALPLSTILIGNTFVNIAAAGLGYVIVRSLAPGNAEPIAIATMTFLLIIFGELVPKRLAIRHSEKWAVRVLPFLLTAVRVLAPFRWALLRLTRPFEIHFSHRPSPLSAEELRTLVDVGEQDGVLHLEESAMMDGILRLEKIEAREVMVPRPDVLGLDLEDPPETWRETVRKAACRYVPAYRGSLDQIEGFLNAPRFLYSNDAGNLQKCMIPHFFVPDTMPLDHILTLFQQEGIHIAVVIDEYGGTDGIITREDILDEIMPDLGQDQPAIVSAGPNRWKVDGNTSIEDVNEALDLRLSAEGADRIAGWFTEKAEHLPKAGEMIEAQQCRATVLEIRKRRIRTILLEKIIEPPSETPSTP